jgi:hypothetical protein
MFSAVARGLLAAGLLLFYQATEIRYDADRHVFALANWTGASQLSPERAAEVFRISVDAPDVPPLLGRYSVEAGTLIFAPQFPLQPGMKYRAEARLPGSSLLVKIVDVPKPQLAATTVVERLYPTTNVLAENHLKFYLHFSAPMSRGFAYDNLALLDEKGTKIDAPFLELGEELWDPEGRRFTLFLDPGRIKRGLVSQQDLGVAIEEGKRYTLVVAKGWKDARGMPLAEEVRKSIVAGPADRKPVDLDAWRIQKPVAGTRNALSVSFPEPMDHAILNREVDIMDSSGKLVDGAISIGPEERSWIFTPAAPWTRGSYSLIVGTSVADLAGNMIDRPFEIDVFDKIDNLERKVRNIPIVVD